MGRHRDNWCAQDAVAALTRGEDVLGDAAGHSVSASGNSQDPLSDVLIWSEGDVTMEVLLSYPRSTSEGDVSSRDSYLVHPRLKFPCAGGTLFVFSHLDDLHYCHEARVVQMPGQGPAASAGCRFAFVFRWLSLEKLFYAAPEKRHAVKLSQEQVAAGLEQARKNKRQKR